MLEYLDEEYKELGEDLKQVRAKINKKLENKPKIKRFQRYVPKNGDKYWYYDVNQLKWLSAHWDSEPEDFARLHTGELFKYKRDTIRYISYIKDLIRYTCNFSLSQWLDPTIRKYFIYYDYFTGKLKVDFSINQRKFGMYYFENEKDAETFMIMNESEILNYQFGIEE